MKNSVISLRVIGVACTLVLAFGFANRSAAEPVVGDGDRLGALESGGLKFGTVAGTTAGDTFSNAKAKSKKYKQTKKKFKSPKTPEPPKVPKSPKATKQKKQKKNKSSKSSGWTWGGDDDDG